MRREPFHSWLVPRIVEPLAEGLGRPLWTTRRRLAELQWRPAAELEQRALDRLRPLLEHASRFVPHYRALFAERGLRARDIQSVRDLNRLPITSKAELRAGFPQQTTAENIPAGRRQRRLTSGSTGLPFEFYWDRSMLPVLGGTDRFWLEWSGIAVWHTRITVASPSYFYNLVTPARRWPALINRVMVGERAESFPADQMTTEKFRALVERVTLHGPYFVRGYPGSLVSLAARLAEEGRPLASYPRAVVTLAETLTGPNAATLREVFRCSVANHYSAWEVPQIAHSCPDHPELLHSTRDRVVVRVVRSDGAEAGPGETGQVVATDLANYVMPFINYSAGDGAMVGPRCPCGRGMPTLARLEGRDIEMIRTREGREMSSGAFGQLLTFVIGIIPYVWEYQAVQTTPEALILRVVPTPRFTAEFQATLQRGLAEFFGPGMQIIVEPVASIPAEVSGKRLIIKQMSS